MSVRLQIHPKIVAQSAHVHNSATPKIAERGRTRPREQATSIISAEQRRRQIEHVSIDQTGFVEGVGDARSPFDEHLQNPPTPQIVEDRPEIAREFKAGMDRSAHRRSAENYPYGLDVSGITLRIRKASGQGWVVGSHCSRSDKNRPTFGPKAMGIETGILAGDPLRRAIRRGGTPVEGRREFQDHQGSSRPTMVKIRGQLNLDVGRTDANDDINTCSPQLLDPGTGNLCIRIGNGNDHPGYPRSDHGVGTGRGQSMMRTRFERHIESAATGLVTGGRERNDFRMRAGHSVRSSDETSMIGLARGYDDCANPRSRRDLTPDCCGYSKGLAHAGHVVRAR
jgi:hypothetical protein